MAAIWDNFLHGGSRMRQPRIYEDVHIAFAKMNAPLKQEVAALMGMRPETFSNHIRHRDAKVDPSWSKRFVAAYRAASK